MNIKQIVDALNGTELANKEELVKGIEALYHKLNNENKDLRKGKEEVLKKVREHASADDDAELDDVLESLGNKSTESSKLAKELAKLQKQVSTIEAEKQQLKAASLERERDNLILKQLSAEGVRKEALEGLQLMFGKMSSLDEAGEWVIGDKDLPQGIKEYVGSNAYVIDAKQKPGSGSTKPKSGETKAYLSSAEFKAMSPAERTANMQIMRDSREQAAKEGKSW